MTMTTSPSRKCLLGTTIIWLSAIYVTAFSTLYPRHRHVNHKTTNNRRDAIKNSDLTDWVIESLEDDNQSITSADPNMAGEGDTLPENGLAIGKVKIFAASRSPEYGDPNTTINGVQDGSNYNNDDGLCPIYLFQGRNGWGTGVHPTTRLCLEWLCDAIQPGDVLLDYGCGSGILSIAALHMDASRCTGVDVEAEALVTAERNMALNGWDADGRFQGRHTREVLPYDVCPPSGVDLCVANILIGQLVRPSMVAAIVTNLQDGGLLCLSGIRPAEVDALKEAYSDSIEWLDDQYAELSANETLNCIESYGFDCGRWARLVGKKQVRASDSSFIEQMSDLAVS